MCGFLRREIPQNMCFVKIAQYDVWMLRQGQQHNETAMSRQVKTSEINCYINQLRSKYCCLVTWSMQRCFIYLSITVVTCQIINICLSFVNTRKLWQLTGCVWSVQERKVRKTQSQQKHCFMQYLYDQFIIKYITIWHHPIAKERCFLEGARRSKMLILSCPYFTISHYIAVKCAYLLLKTIQ